MIKNIINSIINKYNYTLIRKINSTIPSDLLADDFFLEIYNKVKDHSMTSPERLYALIKSVEYIIKHNIPGEFVECGVWRGGSAMAIALTLLKMNETNRKIYMFDTFEGMSEPDENDNDINGIAASNLLAKSDKILNENNIWCYSTLDEVMKSVRKTNYPSENLIFIKGKVEDTIPKTIPNSISLLRLDTDWYASTKHELEFLYPLVTTKGVVIIDDYGHWQGSRKAVDEYIQNHKLTILLTRIDYTGRQFIKL